MHAGLLCASLYVQVQVVADERPEDVVEVLDGGVVKGVGVVGVLVPHRRERRRDQVQDGHVCGRAEEMENGG